MGKGDGLALLTLWLGMHRERRSPHSAPHLILSHVEASPFLILEKECSARQCNIRDKPRPGNDASDLWPPLRAIMILRVLRNTNSNSTVKFWFISIGNFSSPSFLEFIPHLAEAYKFEYDLVTYKWPGPEGSRESFQVGCRNKILILRNIL
ncbi:hypothetical protein B0H13DRAFT_2326866 [Mycena leptocephala]|nr:hypothetical protein B0H13DRAFT_2326866 [Mycena leptocephala]